MAEDKVRIRLVFENRRILSKCQKKEGLNRSWIVLNPKCQRTISEFADHLLRTFSLSEACPSGISLYMEGFVLPPFESISVLKDKDIICVKKKKESLLEICGEEDDENVEVEERPRILPGVMLLADEEFQKETGGYDSESEEDELEEKAEEPVSEKKTSKKRKASSKSSSSRRKKCKLATTEESPDERENTACVTKINAVKKKKKKKPLDEHSTENVEQKNGDAKSMTSSKRSSQREESKGPHDQCQMSAETKKTPSRSARRKKAKRQWLREKAKLEKEELQQKQLVVAPIQKSLITVDYQVTEKALENQEADEEGEDVGDDVTPVEVRPGHIRFKPLAGTEQASLESESPTENFMWNGNMTKKKGQKWGTEKTGYAKRYGQDFNEDISHAQTAEIATPPATQIDFEQLKAYTGSVKTGDVIAYRLIELSSSWTPEVSSFRVGKISQYDPDSKKVTLIPVQEHPIEKKTEDEDEDSSMQPETSLYKEDGSLEIEFSALLDIRSVNTSSSDSTEVANNKAVTPKPDQTATNLKLSANNGSHTLVKENGKVNPWEELSEALSAKKAELSESNNGWNKKGNSTGGGSWSYKALRGSALGPVMNYLRSQKEI